MAGVRRNRGRFFVVFAMAVALIGAINSAQATPVDKDAQAFRDGLISFADRLNKANDALGSYQALAQSVPLVDLAPGSANALRLSTLLQDHLKNGAKKLDATYTSLTELETDLEALDGTEQGVAITVGDVIQSGSVGGNIDFQIPIHASRQVQQPLDFGFQVSGKPAAIEGGSLTISFSLDTTLTFRIDSSIDLSSAVPPTAFSLVGTPAVDLCARANATVASFTARFGFTDISVSTGAPAKVNACAQIQFKDPDSNGVITQDEFTSAALTELADANLVNGTADGGVPADDVDATFAIDASLIPGTSDATIAFHDADLSAAPALEITPIFGLLDDWDNITPGDVATGFAQFVASFSGAQTQGNGPLPFLEQGLSAAFDAAAPLVALARRITDADVICGTKAGFADSDDPTGSTANIADGTTVYCRAKTAFAPVSDTVQWVSPNAIEGANTGDAGIDPGADPENDTVGSAPTKNAVFTLDCPSGQATCTFDVTLTFDADPDGPGGAPQQTFTAIQKPQTALELCNKVAAAASLGANYCDTKLSYSTDTRSLTLRVAGTADPPAANIKVDFGDRLRNATNLTGLERLIQNANPDLDADGSVNASGLAFDLSFGVVLVPNLADITPGPTGDDPNSTKDDNVEPLDRFFVKVDNATDKPELKLQDLTLGANVNLKGKVGFLEVSAAGSDAANPNGGAFDVSRADMNKPVLAVEVKTPHKPLEIQGTSGIDDAIGLEDLLFNLDADHLSAACNLKFSAGLTVSAAVEGNASFANGTASVNWPNVFKANTCTPDTSGIAVAADGNFDANLKQFDPFPSLTGTHNGTDPSDNLVDSTKDFASRYGTTDGSLLNMTLRNKTTGATCKIVSLGTTNLNCTLSGGSRPADEGNKNKWKVGDEYEVEGNALALLGVIIDNLDKLVAQVDTLSPGLTDRQIPVLDVSTKDIVKKIQGLKTTLDDLRGFPLAEINCTRLPNGTGAIEVLPDNTPIYCKATTTKTPTSVTWTGKEIVGAESDLSVGSPVKSNGDPAQMTDTVGPSPTARVPITVKDNEVTDDTTISEWRVQVEFEDAAGLHTADFPQTAPPQSLQDLEKLIERKLGISDPNVFKLDLVDLPTAGAGPVATGTASGGDENTLEDSGADFSDVLQGMQLVNVDDKVSCTIAHVDDSADELECVNPLPNGEEFDNNESYEVVGDGTKDLIVRLGAGYCAGGTAPGSLDCSNEGGVRELEPISLPLNVDLGAGLSDLVGLDTTGELQLQYVAKAQFDIGIPLKIDLTPDVVVLDTTEASVKGRVIADSLGLKANLGPLGIALGTEVTDVDPATDGNQPGTGVVKLGAKLAITKKNGDEIKDNRTFDFGPYFSDLEASFSGDEQTCATGPDFKGDACLVMSMAAEPQVAATTFGDLKITCDAEAFQNNPESACTVTPPPGLAAFFAGQGINLDLLFQVLPKLLEKLEKQLDGAARGVSIPVVGDALDAGANIVGTFNANVVMPFTAFVTQIKSQTDQDTDGDTDPGDIAKVVRKFIYDGFNGAVGGFNGLGPSPGADLLRDLNGDGTVTTDDVVVTPECNGDPCADGAGLGLLTDMRVTFKLGQTAFDTELPFDIGLKGFPLRLTGSVASAGKWSVLVDFGMSKADGPYLVASGKPTKENDPSMAVNRPPDVAATDPDGVPNSGDETPAVWYDQQYLEDDGANFPSFVEKGMTLRRLPQGSATEDRCTITKVESNKLWCDDFSNATTVEGITWHFHNPDDPTDTKPTDLYEVIALHPPNANQTGGAAEVSFDASVGFGDNAGACVDDVDPNGTPPRPYLAGFSTSRCLRGEVAFLAVTVRDKDGDRDTATYDEEGGASAETDEDPTKLGLAATIDLRKTTSGDRITFADLTAGKVTVEPSFSATANVDVRFRTGLNIGQPAGFPSVLGKIHLFWKLSVGLADPVDVKPLDIEFDGLNLDAGKFVTQFLKPITDSVKNITKPLQPVIEFLQAPLPVISDISEAVGQGPVTPLDLLEAVSGNDLSLVRSVIQFVNFVNTLPTDGNLLIELGNSPGAFGVSADRAKNTAPTVDQADKGLEVKSSKTNLQNDFAGSSAYAKFDDAPADDRPGTFGVAGLTFPIFSDAKNIFAVLLGQDQTLVRYDAGTLRAKAGFGYSFPPIMAGPIPVVISLGGEFEVRGRFAIGYDTSGLRKVLEGGSGVHLLDGVFIDDLDASGTDVPEIQFIGTVYAEGAASVAIISVGVRGALIFTTSLDLDDRPTPDGKLRIEEIVSKLNNPICLFVVSGQLDVSLSAFVEIDLFFFTKRFTIEIVRVTLLKFEVKCEPEVPNLADVEGGNLILNTGPRADKRNVQESETNEKFTVRQMESYGSESTEHNGQTRFSISAFGIVEDEFLSTAAVDAGTATVITGGITSGPGSGSPVDVGDDTYSFLGGGKGGAGGTSPPSEATDFKAALIVWAGDGNDTITTGDGNDVVRGGPGNDSISTGKGVDDVRGGQDDDTIDVGEANDVQVFGESGNDTISGGPGADTIDGGSGDDNLGGAGGPAADDGGDTLIGGNGNDTLAGVSGDDTLIGDADDSCTDNTLDDGTPRRDALDGGPGNDKLYGGPQDDQLTGGDGDDELCGNRQNDQIDGGAGKDHAEGGAHNDNIVGGQDASPAANGGDQLYGDFATAPATNATSGRDFVLGDEGTLTLPDGNTAADPTPGFVGTFEGNDLIVGGGANDVLYGQAGVDDMRGGTGNDFMRGQLRDDLMRGDGGGDEMYGDEGLDTMYGSDDLPQALDQDNPATIAGDDGVDVMRGGLGTDLMFGDEDDDEMYGDNDVDTMYGGRGDDLMRGGGADDDIEGNANDTEALPADADPLDHNGDGDVIYGDGGEDDITGGSHVDDADADSGDTILGNVAQDVIIGDNGDITRPNPQTFELDGTKTRAIDLESPTTGGGDNIQGNEENDDVYGGGGDDEINGNAGDDYLEGNGGSDHVFGGDQQDDIVGGTSPAAEDGPAPGTGGGEADGDDVIHGNAGHDLIAGDNASIFRPEKTPGPSDCPPEPDASAGYDCNTFSGAAQSVVIRRVVIYDVYTTGQTPDLTLSGDDTINGNDGHDIVYGGDGVDTVHGNHGDDEVFGNNGDDILFGDEDQDDLIGGTGRTDSSSATSALDGRLDGADTIHGNGSFDAIAGDNARMVRSTTDGDASDNTGSWKTNTFNAAVDRTIALLDVGVVGSAAGAGTSGNDELLGDDADDVIYGQGGNDGISGGNDQDILEGNANGTGNAPDPDDTYGAAWPTFAGDVIHGDAGADDIAGGTGWIYRMVGGVETGDPISDGVRVGADFRKDGGDEIFGDDDGDAIAGDNTVIERALDGGAWIHDNLHSPEATDVIRRITRERDVATTTNLAPLTNGTSGDDIIRGNDGVDVAYGQGGDDDIQGNDKDDHLEGNAGDDAVQGNAGRDDLIGGTGRTFSNDESTAVAGHIDNAVDDDASNDALYGGNADGTVTGNDDDLAVGDNATVDRMLGLLPAPGSADLGRLPFNGTWGETTWNKPNILRVIRLLDVSVTGATAPEANGTNGNDTIKGEAGDDLLFGEGADDTINGDTPADANAGDDYIEGNGGADVIRGDGREDDIAGGGSAANGVLDANRDGTLDPTRSGETLRDAGDTINGDTGDVSLGLGDVVAGDNARIQRPLDGGDWRTDAQRQTKLRDVFLFDIRLVGNTEPGNADPGESGPDTISGNGGNDVLFGQDNGQTDDAAGDAYGREAGAGAPNCQNAASGPGTGTISATGEEAPTGDDDDDDLPDINDPQCRVTNPAGDTINGQDGQDYIEGNSGSDNLFGDAGEDDVLGGSSANTGHVNAVLPPGDRDAGFAPKTIAEANKPYNLNDGHDFIEGNGEDDTVVGDNAFVDRYLGAAGVWVTVAGPGGGPYAATPNPNAEPERFAWTATELIRRDVTTKAQKEDPLAFGNDFIKGGQGKDDVYGLLGNDWLEGNEEEDAIVGDMGKIVDNQIDGGTPDDLADPSPLNQFLAPEQPFLGSTINYTGMLKREVTLYAFDQSQSTAGIGHDIALGGAGNDWIHTGPGEDLANGNAGDDRIFLGDNATAITATKVASESKLAHDRVDAGWGGGGHDHLFGGYGADYLDVRPRTTTSAPGLFPASDPETWFQVAGTEPSQNGVSYGQQNFEDVDYIYGGWDQDTLQANVGDNGPAVGDRLLDWSGSFNGYYLCPSTYGDWVSTRAIAPGLIEFLEAMAFGDGAGGGPTFTTYSTHPGTSEDRETAIVFPREVKDNTKPIHADTPAHFTCGPGTVTP